MANANSPSPCIAHIPPPPESLPNRYRRQLPQRCSRPRIRAVRNAAGSAASMALQAVLRRAASPLAGWRSTTCCASSFRLGCRKGVSAAVAGSVACLTVSAPSCETVRKLADSLYLQAICCLTGSPVFLAGEKTLSHDCRSRCLMHGHSPPQVQTYCRSPSSAGRPWPSKFPIPAQSPRASSRVPTSP